MRAAAAAHLHSLCSAVLSAQALPRSLWVLYKSCKGLTRANGVPQSCERAVEDVGKPMIIAARENMVNLVAAMTREWEVATHNATLAAQQVRSHPSLSICYCRALAVENLRRQPEVSTCM